MVEFEGFGIKKTPLTREQLEKESRGVQKTGEILRGMKPPPEARRNEESGSFDRDAQRAEGLQKEMLLFHENARALPGFERSRALKEELKGKSPVEKKAALRAFDREFPVTRGKVATIAAEIRKRQTAIGVIEERKRVGDAPFIPLEEAA